MDEVLIKDRHVPKGQDRDMDHLLVITSPVIDVSCLFGNAGVALGRNIERWGKVA